MNIPNSSYLTPESRCLDSFRTVFSGMALSLCFVLSGCSSAPENQTVSAAKPVTVKPLVVEEEDPFQEVSEDVDDPVEAQLLRQQNRWMRILKALSVLLKESEIHTSERPDLGGLDEFNNHLDRILDSMNKNVPKSSR